ncbi:hypothetical protein SDRG_10178 [Saprolegnia diclina VS20]|uniref:Uncharacterized protein n=1 Tax=Saprolegnia diclina (strain VS20) TaxID=1156394 RepID=T0RI68_SAPDV|nr:hypothetical protein SDRG_10178 [Saprolegnia diclina VS20]EQC31978.1 hypothetical protein SDRG_10178 [Saprolegnia diclina VS20]|eukprot:XP_008614380.1 hypothetical protein SDRG_10178 [Saprolegnia diclina VS20]
MACPRPGMRRPITLVTRTLHCRIDDLVTLHFIMSETITAPGLFEKTFSTNETLHGLYLDVPGRVIVRANDGGNATDVTIASNSAALLNLVLADVTYRYYKGTNNSYLNLTHAYPDATTAGALVVTVRANAPVSYISSQAQTVVHDGALASSAQANVTLRAYDAGSIHYASNASLAAYNLKLDAADASTVQVSSSSLNVTYKLSLTAEDRGVVALAADVAVVPSAKAVAQDAGAVYLQAVDHVEVGKLVVDAEDLGRVNVYPHGTCVTGKITAEDAGVANVGSVVCQDVYASASDGGAVTVQVTGVLSASTQGYSVVQYFNATPLELPKTRRPSKKHSVRGPNVLATPNNTFDSFVFTQSPLETPIAVKLFPRLTKSYWGGSWTTLSAVSSPAEAGSLFAVVAVCVLALVLVVVKRSGRGVRYHRIQ